MDHINLKAMTNTELLSLIFQARAVMSDRERAKSREFKAAIARAEAASRPSPTSPEAQEATDHE